MREQYSEEPVVLDRHDNIDDRYIPPGFCREPISPLNERENMVVSVNLDYESGNDGDLRIVQD